MRSDGTLSRIELSAWWPGDISAPSPGCDLCVWAWSGKLAAFRLKVKSASCKAHAPDSHGRAGEASASGAGGDLRTAIPRTA